MGEEKEEGKRKRRMRKRRIEKGAGEEKSRKK